MSNKNQTSCKNKPLKQKPKTRLSTFCTFKSMNRTNKSMKIEVIENMPVPETSLDLTFTGRSLHELSLLR